MRVSCCKDIEKDSNYQDFLNEKEVLISCSVCSEQLAQIKELKNELKKVRQSS